MTHVTLLIKMNKIKLFVPCNTNNVLLILYNSIYFLHVHFFFHYFILFASETEMTKLMSLTEYLNAKNLSQSKVLQSHAVNQQSLLFMPASCKEIKHWSSDCC